MKLKYRNIGLTILMLWGGILMASSPTGSKEFRKSFNESFTTNADVALEVQNKYGNVDITTWNKNEVLVKAEIIVNARSESAANEIFDNVSVGISGNRNRVSAITSINSSKNYSCDDGKYEVHYFISAPASARPDIYNKYGNITIGELKNDLEVEIKYGNLDTENIDGKLNLIIGYGNANVGELGPLDLEIKYGKFKSGNIKGATIISKYSTVKIGNGDDFDITSKYDTYRLGEIGDLMNAGKYDNFRIEKVKNVDLQTKYTTFKTNHLSESMRFEGKYGSIGISELSDDFKSLNFVCRYTPIKIGTTAEFKIEAETKYCSVGLPYEMDYTEKVKDGKYYSIKAKTSDRAKGVIKADLEYGSLKIYD